MVSRIVQLFGNRNHWTSRWHIKILGFGSRNSAGMYTILLLFLLIIIIFQILYKLKTAKVFEKPKNSHSDSGNDNPFAIHHIYLCSESRRLCVAGAVGQVMLFKFRKVELTSEVMALEISILYENFDDIYGTSPECDFIPHQVQKTESSDSDKVNFL